MAQNGLYRGLPELTQVPAPDLDQSTSVGAIAAITLVVLLATACCVEVPLFKAPDEHNYNTDQHLAATRRPPVASEGVLSRQEAASGGILDDRCALRIPPDIRAGRLPVQVRRYDPSKVSASRIDRWRAAALRCPLGRLDDAGLVNGLVKPTNPETGWCRVARGLAHGA
jgi:hypothetical protein